VTAVLVIVVLVIVVAVVVALAVRARRRADPVDSFRRTIDALGPEARRPVVDQVRRTDDDSDQNGEDAS